MRGSAGLKVPIFTPTFSVGDFDKWSRWEWLNVRWGFISRSVVSARLKVFGCSGYDLWSPSWSKIGFLHFDPCRTPIN